MARLAKVRQDMALARAKRIASEFAKTRDLGEQVLQYAKEYDEAAMQAGQKGISVSMLNDSVAFSARLVASAKEQELANAYMHKQLQEANRAALAAKMKSQGLDRALAQRKKEAEQAQQQADWQEIEDAFSNRRSPLAQGAGGEGASGTKDA
jgi:flagellar biosynthesis chaperone FliJ